MQKSLPMPTAAQLQANVAPAGFGTTAAVKKDEPKFKLAEKSKVAAAAPSASELVHAIADAPAEPEREFTVQQQKDGKWGWHAQAKANKEITFQGQSHPNPANAERAIRQELSALGVPNAQTYPINVLPPRADLKAAPKAAQKAVPKAAPVVAKAPAAPSKSVTRPAAKVKPAKPTSPPKIKMPTAAAIAKPAAAPLKAIPASAKKPDSKIPAKKVAGKK